MSCSLDIGAVPYCSPVVGSTRGIVAPLTESTSSPPMKFLTVVTKTNSCSVEPSEVLEHQGKYVETFVEQFVADAQRREEAQDVAKGATGQDDHACGMGARAQRLGEVGVGLGGTRLDQLDGDHGPATPDVADAVVVGLQAAQAVLHQGLDLTGACHQSVGLDGLDGRERRSAGNWIAAVGSAETADVRRVHDLRATC